MSTTGRIGKLGVQLLIGYAGKKAAEKYQNFQEDSLQSSEEYFIDQPSPFEAALFREWKSAEEELLSRLAETEDPTTDFYLQELQNHVYDAKKQYEEAKMNRMKQEMNQQSALMRADHDITMDIIRRMG